MTGPAEPLTLNVDDLVPYRAYGATRGGIGGSVGVGTASVAVLQVKRRGLPTPSPYLSHLYPMLASLVPTGCDHDRRRPSARGPAWGGRAIALDFLRLGRGWRPSRRYPI